MARALSQDLRDRVISAVDGVSNSHNVTMFSLLETYGVHRHLVEHIDKKLQLHFLTLERTLNTAHWSQCDYVFIARALSR